MKSHVSRLLATLELPSRVHAVIWAYETGFVRRGTRPEPVPGSSVARCSRPGFT